MRRKSFFGTAENRRVLCQVALLLLVASLAVQFALNAKGNLEAQNIRFGLDFLGDPASFGVSQSLIPYSEQNSYGRVFLVGLLNTLLVSFLGIVFATILGFAIGIARLSPNLLLARLAGGYVEAIRNLPLLFQILFWYLAVLGALPGPRQSLSLFDAIYLNNRGLIVPRVLPAAGAGAGAIALLLAVLAAMAVVVWARRRQQLTGRTFPSLSVALLLIIGLPLLAALWAGVPLHLQRPLLHGFNFINGIKIIPEFVALLIGLTVYTAAFIAEIVRAGILAVPRGQMEAAQALGLRRGKMLRLIVVPQALRVIVPPLTSQYLNLIKNSSLAVAIGYPDLVAVFAGTTLNQTHQAIEIIAMTMAVYLVISLATSMLMNFYNARLRARER